MKIWHMPHFEVFRWNFSSIMWRTNHLMKMEKIGVNFFLIFILFNDYLYILLASLSYDMILQLQKVSSRLPLNPVIPYAKRQKNSRIRYLQFFFFFFSLFLRRPVPFIACGLYIAQTRTVTNKLKFCSIKNMCMSSLEITFLPLYWNTFCLTPGLIFWKRHSRLLSA